MRNTQPRSRSHPKSAKGRRLLLAFSTILCPLFPLVASAKVTLFDQSVITHEGLYFWYPNGEKAFHYAPSISPRGDCFTVEAELVDVQNGQLICIVDGQRLKLPVLELRDEDIEFLKQWHSLRK